MLQSRQTYHHSILRQTWPTANRYRHGPKESESIGQPPKILSGGLVLKSEQKGHISVLNHRKKKRTLKSHRQKFKINSRQPHKNRSRSTGVSWHARWAPRNSSCCVLFLLFFQYFHCFLFSIFVCQLNKKHLIWDIT